MKDEKWIRNNLNQKLSLLVGGFDFSRIDINKLIEQTIMLDWVLKDGGGLRNIEEIIKEYKTMKLK